MDIHTTLGIFGTVVWRFIRPSEFSGESYARSHDPRGIREGRMKVHTNPGLLGMAV